MAVRSRIAEAYVQVVPAADGFFSQLSGMVNPAISMTGNKAGSNFGNIFTKAASKAMNVAKITAGLAGAGAAIAAGFAVKGGISRALNIEDAEAKLMALKYSAEDIASVSDSAMKSVQGTSFAFDKAMSTAAGSLAAGVKQGDDLTGYLSLIGDAAVVAGADFDDIGYVFNKVQANTKAFTEELNMLADRGIPVFAWLAEEAGVSMGELRKQVSAGEVSSEMFLKAIEKNIGGAATTAASTTRGYFANFGSAMSRLGATMVGGSLEPTKNALKDFIPVIDALTGAVSENAATFWTGVNKNVSPLISEWAKNTAAAIEAGGIGATFSTIINWISSSIEKLQEFYANVMASPAMTTLITWAQAAAASVTAIYTAIASSPITQMLLEWAGYAINWLAHLRPIGDIFTDYILPVIQQVGEFLAPFVENLGTLIGSVFNSIRENSGGLLDGLMGIASSVGAVISQVVGLYLTVIQPVIGQIIGSIVGLLATTLPSVMELIGSVLGSVAEAIGAILPLLTPLIASILGVVSTVIAAILPVFQKIMPMLIDIIATAMPIVAELAGAIAIILADVINMAAPLFEQIVGLVGSVLGYLMEIIATALPLLMPILDIVLNIIGSVVEAIMPLLTTIIPIVQNLLAVILPIAKDLLNLIAPLIGSLLEQLTPLITMIAEILQAIVEPILLMVAPLIEALLPIIGSLVKVASALLSILVPIVTIIVGILGAVIVELMPVIELIISAVTFLVELIAWAVEGIATLFQGIIWGLINILAWAWNPIADILNALQIEIPGWLQDLLGIGGTIGFNVAKIVVPEVPALHTGGNIAGSPDGTLVRAGDRNRAETVTDLGLTNRFIASTLNLVEGIDRGGVNQAPPAIYNIHPSEGMDEEALARKIDRIARRNARLA